MPAMPAGWKPSSVEVTAWRSSVGTVTRLATVRTSVSNGTGTGPRDTGPPVVLPRRNIWNNPPIAREPAMERITTMATNIWRKRFSKNTLRRKAATAARTRPWSDRGPYSPPHCCGQRRHQQPPANTLPGDRTMIRPWTSRRVTTR